MKENKSIGIVTVFVGVVTFIIGGIGFIIPYQPEHLVYGGVAIALIGLFIFEDYLSRITTKLKSIKWMDRK